MSDAARFWDKRAERYAQRPVGDPEAYEKKLEITRMYFRPDSEVLEMGCGTGSTALAHAPHAGHILATDISPAMIDIARRRGKAGGAGNVTFETRAVADHALAESAYDAILALNLLHLLEDPRGAIGAAHVGLRPGGVFVTSTACIGDMSWYFNKGAGYIYRNKCIRPLYCGSRALFDEYIGAAACPGAERPSHPGTKEQSEQSVIPPNARSNGLPSSPADSNGPLATLVDLLSRARILTTQSIRT